MQYYIVLTIATGIIALVGVLLWLKTKSLIFPFGLAFIYYLSLYGAWFIVFDKSGGDSGMHYAYLEEKMFPINLNEYYLASLIVYTIFIVALAGTTLLFVRPCKGKRGHHVRPLTILHVPIIIVCSLAAIWSYLIVKDGLEAAASLNVPAYVLMKRGFGEAPPFFTLHQILNRVALIPASIGLVVALSGKEPRLLLSRFSILAIFSYVLIISGMISLAFVLGYKSEIFYAGLVGCFFYLANATKPKLFLAGFVGLAVVVAMSLVDKLRWVSIADLPSALFRNETVESSSIFAFMASSNEAFASHFSMYGVLALDVPVTYGLSLVSLIASAVPRILWSSRPADIYAYYVDSVNAMPGQGYTIHHATGWYLNFGMIGVLIGALIFGWLWAKCFNLYLSANHQRSKLVYIFSAIAPWTFTAYIPFLMHAGPEVYKGLVIEAFLLPTLVLMFATIRWRLDSRPLRFLQQ
jgi:hypothetical protein